MIPEDTSLSRSDILSLIGIGLAILIPLWQWIYKKWIAPWLASRTKTRAIKFLAELESQERFLSFVYLNEDVRLEYMLETIGKGIRFLVLIGGTIIVAVIMGATMFSKDLIRIGGIFLFWHVVRSFFRHLNDDLINFPTKLGLHFSLWKLRQKIIALRSKLNIEPETKTQKLMRMAVDVENARRGDAFRDFDDRLQSEKHIKESDEEKTPEGDRD